MVQLHSISHYMGEHQKNETQNLGGFSLSKQSWIYTGEMALS